MLTEEKIRIENIIADIMINDGSDKHCDGCDIIADYFAAYIDGEEDMWLNNYFSKKERYLTNK